ncbi:hypothetical protein [Thiothrix nivea]|uniref:Uncharacterized protein n=1 Tax=Thiothrix nivea (strain ATCC 35100 / DSM 5205 / JP2) TaxID=870187 RepID=A0A656HJ40_THINJ|nr:hypothetical protein [Thiothrix nivea]EIJ35410.1 hypothetical protein Thini_2879 [Thiothrix nivea DSM 5205]
MFETILAYISNIESVLALGGRILGLKKLLHTKVSETKIDSVENRFLILFEKHGVNRNQIPRFFGHGLMLDDVSSPEKLLPKLTHEMLQDASDLFAIRLEWLECTDDIIYPIYQHHFYQAPERFQRFLLELKLHGDQHHLSAHFVVSNNPKLTDYNAFFYIQELIGELGDKQIVRYHLCSHQWTHQYWKARADLAACVAIACATLGDAWGFQTKDDISAFDRGERFLSELDNLQDQKKTSKNPQRKGNLWRPEDWVADPASFLDGVDEGKRGKVFGLSRWLEHYNQGLMNTRFPMYANAAEAFEAELEKHTN